ncbi:MAG: prepilin peptidase [Alkalibacterium sp.]|nr:prepilin peptidase [Alkalibacterium sp.]
MELLLVLIFFMYGLIFGSFFNVVGLRVPTQSLFKETRSYCDTCERTLTWKELIPVFSYLIQWGKCKKCHQSISILYPLMEMGTGLLFALAYWQFGWSYELVLGLLLISLVIPVTVSDIAYKRIPNRLLLFFAPFFLVYRFIFPLSPFWLSFAGAMLAFLIVFLVIVLSKGGMGVGDLKYFTLFGFIFGPIQFLLLFFLSTLYGTVGGLITMRVKNVGKRTKIAFGPYIGLAALTVFFIGYPLIDWYLTLF